MSNINHTNWVTAGTMLSVPTLLFVSDLPLFSQVPPNLGQPVIVIVLDSNKSFRALTAAPVSIYSQRSGVSQIQQICDLYRPHQFRRRSHYCFFLCTPSYPPLPYLRICSFLLSALCYQPSITLWMYWSELEVSVIRGNTCLSVSTYIWWCMFCALKTWHFITDAIWTKNWTLKVSQR